DLLDRLLLILHVSFDGLNQVGDQVMAPLELHIDLLPAVLDLMLESHEPVVGPSDPSSYENQSAPNHPAHRRAGPPFSSRIKITFVIAPTPATTSRQRHDDHTS